MNWEGWIIFGAMMLTCGLCGALGASLAFKWLTRGGLVFSVKSVKVVLNGEPIITSESKDNE